jgi:hypothetical protein
MVATAPVGRRRLCDHLSSDHCYEQRVMGAVRSLDGDPSAGSPGIVVDLAIGLEGQSFGHAAVDETHGDLIQDLPVGPVRL